MKKDLKGAVIEYFAMDMGVFVNNPDETIFVSDCIIDNKKYKVYFKNRTLKHFVERRKSDLAKRNDVNKSLEIILGMIDDLHQALEDYTRIELNIKRENSYLLYKNFDDPNKTPVTAVLEVDSEGGALIISYYFTKR